MLFWISLARLLTFKRDRSYEAYDSLVALHSTLRYSAGVLLLALQDGECHGEA